MRKFWKIKSRPREVSKEEVKGLILLNEVSEAMKADRLLRGLGYRVKAVAPPPEVRKGCDLSIEFALIDRLGVERVLRENEIPALDIVPLDYVESKPLEITKEVDYGKHLMIRAANMKLTFEKSTGKIVNISGGGCPDVPYLTLEMVGKSLDETPEPETIGFSLCAFMLQKAYSRALEKFSKEI